MWSLISKRVALCPPVNAKRDVTAVTRAIAVIGERVYSWRGTLGDGQVRSYVNVMGLAVHNCRVGS